MIRTLTLLLLVCIPVMITTPLHIMICLEEIISKQFLPGEVIVFSLPSTIPDEDMLIIDGAIANISSKEKWPLLISTDSQSTDAEIPEPQHGYVIVLVPDEDLITSLEIQIETLRTFSFSYNRRGKFIIVVLLEEFEDSHILSNEILNTVWNKDNIINAVVILRSMVKYDAPIDEDRQVYDIYSLFPFRSEHCGEFNNSDLLDQWALSEGFLTGNELMPEKLSNDLQGCFLHIDIYNTPPFVFISNYTDTQGNVVNEMHGIVLVFLKLISEAMNVSMKFEIDKGWDTVYGRLMEGRGIAVGAYLMIAQLYSYADPTIPYVYSDFLLYVPCAKKNPSSGNVLKVFSTAVWLVSVSVLLLVSTLFFILQQKDFKLSGYDTISSSILNVWAVFLSASVSCMPTNTYFRVFFLLFVCFCFALNTVFQSFFTSHLIDPGYEKQIESIEDMNEMGMTLMYDEFTYLAEQLTGVKFVSLFKHSKICSVNCHVIMFKYQNSSLLQNKFKMEYYASTIGVNKLCTAWQYDKIGMVINVSKGHPILAKFNFYIRKCLENGFLERYWSNFVWNNIILNMNNGKENSDSYCPFDLNHLRMCFLFLVIGHILSICTLCSEYVWFKYFSKWSTNWFTVKIH